MSNEKQVIVPQSDIDKLEEARLLMYKLFPCESTEDILKIQQVTAAMWRLTHKRHDLVGEVINEGSEL